jgi:hypothetical protein
LLVGKGQNPFLFFLKKEKVYWNVSIWLWFCNKISYFTCFVSFIIPNIQSTLMNNNLVWYLCVCMYALYIFNWFFVLDNGQPTVGPGQILIPSTSMDERACSCVLGIGIHPRQSLFSDEFRCECVIFQITSHKSIKT